MSSSFQKIRHFIGALCIIQCSLGYAKQIPTQSAPKSKVTAFSELERWNRRQAVSLKDHQLKPIAYLEAHPEQKGIVAYHELGSGKTLLAIGFAERNPDRTIFIVAPHFLEAHWREELEKWGVQNKGRYRFFSHSNPEALLKEDLSNAIVLLDESHRWIETLRTYHQASSPYGKLYYKLRNAHRILALTGTMIYTDAMDLVYHLNLVSGKDLFPFNHEEFRLKYSKIHTSNAFWRGHLIESAMMYPYLLLAPMFQLGLSVLSQGLNLPNFIDSMTGVYAYTPSVGILQSLFMPMWKYPSRVFDPASLQNIISPYISYYSFEKEARFYPDKFSYTNQLSYNYPQINCLFKLANSRLNQSECMQILKDNNDTPINNAHALENDLIHLNTSNIQDHYKNQAGAGREIGNLLFIEEKDPEKKVIFPERFHKILQVIRENKGPVVVYSHYYYNGLLLFKQFLDTSEYKGQYRIYHPEMPKDQHSQIVREFNTNKVKILLLHPHITEGISLKGARQLHFLEMPYNSALSKQIIGRTIRYGSHLHLPKHEQNVTVFFWKYVISFWQLQRHQMLREDWHHNFGEVNYYGNIGTLITDKNFLLKVRSPDDKAHEMLVMLDTSVEIFRQFVKCFSIETLKHSTSQESNS